MKSTSRRILELLVKNKLKPGEFMDVYRKNNFQIEKTVSHFNGPRGRQLEFTQETKTGGRKPGTGSIEKLLHYLEENGIGLVDISRDDYPGLLRQIYYPPLLLFKKGIKNIGTGFNIAVVGSRRCTAYGREVAEDIGRNLSRLGITVVSGLAIGIDSCAHRGALKEKGGSIGVLGCGIDVIYPPENRTLFKNMQENGAIITEFFPGTPPLRQNFPVRNRIISGLCRGVVIIEAGEKSGAVITGETALRQDREVFAVPGSIFSTQSRGCHRLIKSGAKLVEGIDDILEELSQYFAGKHGNLKKEARSPEPGSGEDPDKNGLSRDQRKVYDALRHKPGTLENIVRATGIEVKEALRILAALELKKLAYEDSSGKYIKV